MPPLALVVNRISFFNMIILAKLVALNVKLAYLKAIFALLARLACYFSIINANQIVKLDSFKIIWD